MGNEISATEAYEKSIELDTYNVDAYICWSMFHFSQNDFERAIEIMEMGLEDQPDESEFYYRIAIYKISDGKIKEALNYLEVALNLYYEGHIILFEFFTDLKTQKTLYKIVEQYKPEK